MTIELDALEKRQARERAFAAARAETRAAVQRTTPDQRLDWLEEMLALARASGALEREVRRRRSEREP